jgi:pimeloyl-ACP methyl ester carboxylesterase
LAQEKMQESRRAHARHCPRGPEDERFAGPLRALNLDCCNAIALEVAFGDAIPGARRVVVPACGHLSPLEQPQMVTEALVAFLRD